MGRSARHPSTVDREQISFGLHPPPVDSQGLEQGWTERYLAISTAFALGNANHHALAVDVADFEPAEFRARHGGGIQVIVRGRWKRLLGELIQRSAASGLSAGT